VLQRMIISRGVAEKKKGEWRFFERGKRVGDALRVKVILGRGRGRGRTRFDFGGGVKRVVEGEG
jgi:hypothetical protein